MQLKQDKMRPQNYPITNPSGGLIFDEKKAEEYDKIEEEVKLEFLLEKYPIPKEKPKKWRL